MGFKAHTYVAWASAQMTSWVGWLCSGLGQAGPASGCLAGALVLLPSEHDPSPPVLGCDRLKKKLCCPPNVPMLIPGTCEDDKRNFTGVIKSRVLRWG